MDELPGHRSRRPAARITLAAILGLSACSPGREEQARPAPEAAAASAPPPPSTSGASGAPAPPAQASDVGPFARALWLVHAHGRPEALRPANDLKVKATLAKALRSKEGVATAALAELIPPYALERLAGEGGTLDAGEIQRAVEAATPATRRRILPALAAHADYLTTTYDLLDPARHAAAEEILSWILERYEPGKPLDLIAVCTGNSRRSALSAAMGNLAAAYHGLPGIRFHSGGTQPSALNSRTITALKEIGFEIQATGQEAPRGEPGTANPIHLVRWGVPGAAGEPAFEARESSKRYDDAQNPQQGFAALMVCDEADESCPTVRGAAKRISMPLLDPKIYDGGSYEAAKYRERRDDIGRLMLSILGQARRALEVAGKLR